MVVKRFDVFLVTLDPTIGVEIKKSRPCLVVSPNEMNRHRRTDDHKGHRVPDTSGFKVQRQARADRLRSGQDR